MDNYSEYRPKDTEILVGDKKLKVKEYVAAKRDAVFSIIFEAVDIVPLIQPFLDAVKELKTQFDKSKKKEDVTINMGNLAGELKMVFQKLLTKRLTQLSCLTLDVPLNRTAVDIKKGDLVTDEEHGFEYCPEMFRWVRDNLTQKQEQRMIEVIMKVNDFVGLAKNYWTLATSVSKVAGDEKKKKSQPSQ